ncbi:MAG: long-chain fatty acid--CoA ligase [Chloroflexi bacterium]|nr:long-chain fatty acid--CoA ligase [Chloroflexota bacterium]
MTNTKPPPRKEATPAESEPYPWLKSYDSGVPATLKPYPHKTLLDIVAETARERPQHPAFLFKGARISYARLQRESQTFASALADMGIKPGDRVALLIPNSPQFFIAQFGAWKAGAIVSPLNPLYTERELKHALNYVGARTAVVLTPFYAKLKALQAETPVQRVIATNIKEYLPGVLRLLFTLFKEKKEGHRISLERGDTWMQDLMRDHRDAPLPDVTIKPEDPALLMFTGGTTGLPKAAINTHQGLIMTGMQIKAWFGELLVDWEDIILALMPMFHIYGQAGIATTGFLGHHPLALVPNPRDMDDVLATIRKNRPAFLPGVPTLFIAMMNHPDVQAGKADLSSLKLNIAGAAPLLYEIKQRFEKLTGGRMAEAYALTETTCTGAMTPVLGRYKPGAVGLPFPDVELRIADLETVERKLPLGETGEILIHAPQLMIGYWNLPEETAKTIREIDGKRWLCTGDIGFLDEDGYLHIVDRKKDLIKPSGFQVWPREVEEVIASHPAVVEVGVVGVPDEYQGEAVKAWVVLQPGQTLTAKELKDWCRQHLAAYKVPRYVEFCSDLPKSTVGKVLRRMLRESSEQPPESQAL